MAIPRRTLLAAGAGVAAAWALRPNDLGAAPDPYFDALSKALKPLAAMPTLVLDLERFRANLAQVRRIAHPKLPLRLVVKSLPAIRLVDEALSAWSSKRAMLFNAPQLVQVARERPQMDILLGKPLPVSAAAWALDAMAGGGFDPSRQLQWLVDTPQRAAEYAALASQRGQTLRVNVEIDVGLHRGGIETPADMVGVLNAIKAEPKLQFAGLMGYDAHLAAIPDLPGLRESSMHIARTRYAEMLTLVRQHLGSAEASGSWTLNTAGSPTFHLHDDSQSPNELAVGSAAVKPSDFDKPSLEALMPAAFIATPVLKAMDSFRLPQGVESLSSAAAWWDVNQRRAFAIHGGHWLADPVSPPGVSPSGLYGSSSNQQVMVASSSARLQTGDWLFLRPRQSEAVFLQFGAMAVVDQGRVIDTWPVFPASA